MRNFPTIVRDVILDLQNSKDERLETMLKIAPKPEHDLYFKTKDMWQAIAKTEKRYGNLDSKDWVYDFLDAIENARTLPVHAYLNEGDREEVAVRIKELTQSLKSVYSAYELNANLISNDGQFFDGFTAQDGSFRGFGLFTEEKRLKGDKEISINETLDFFEEYTLEELRQYALTSKRGDERERTRFVRELGHRNIKRYGDPLNKVLRIATEALYGHEYNRSNVHNLVYGRRS